MLQLKWRWHHHRSFCTWFPPLPHFPFVLLYRLCSICWDRHFKEQLSGLVFHICLPAFVIPFGKVNGYPVAKSIVYAWVLCLQCSTDLKEYRFQFDKQCSLMDFSISFTGNYWQTVKIALNLEETVWYE